MIYYDALDSMHIKAAAVVIAGTSLGILFVSHTPFLKFSPGELIYDIVRLPQLQATVLMHDPRAREIQFALPQGERVHVNYYNSDTQFYAWEIHATEGIVKKIYPKYSSAEFIQPDTFAILRRSIQAPAGSLVRVIIIETKEI